MYTTIPRGFHAKEYIIVPPCRMKAQRVNRKIKRKDEGQHSFWITPNRPEVDPPGGKKLMSRLSQAAALIFFSEQPFAEAALTFRPRPKNRRP